MADFTQSGGSSGGTYAKYYTGKLSVWENSYDTASNTSNVGYRLQLLSGSSGQFSGLNASFSITINGQQVKSGSGQYSLGHNGTITFAEGTMTVGHNTDGSKTINCSAVIDFQSHTYSPGDFYPNGNLSLTKIPRYTTVTNSQKAKTINSISINWKTTDARDHTQYSLNGGTWTDAYDTVASDNKSGYYTISNLSPNTAYTIKTRCKRTDSQLWSESSAVAITTYDIAKLTSVPNVNIGSAHTLTWSNPSGATINLKLCKTNNSTIIDYGTVTGTSKSITPTASTIYALTQNSNTYTARYILTTTANEKSYTNSKDFKFTVKNSNPTFSNFTYKDTNETITALTGNNQILVKGYSKVQGTISIANKAVAKNSATMKTYKMLIGSKSGTATYSSSADVNITLSGIDTNVIDMYATDSRGNSTKVTKTATFKNYSKIAITSLKATRTNNVGTEVTLAFKATFWNSSFGSVKNAIKSCVYKYKLTSASSYTTGSTTLTYSISENTITGSLSIKGDLGAEGFDASNSYNIQLTIADKLSTATSTITLGSGNPAIAVYKNNVAIGEKYDTSDGSKLQVNGNIKATTFNKYTLKDACTKGIKTLSSKGNVGWSNQTDGDNYLITKAFIVFWNGRYNDTSSNLTYCHQGEIQAKPTVLYNNSSGTTGTITLSETAANFNYIEIIFINQYSQMVSTGKIPYDSSRRILLQAFPIFSDSQVIVANTNTVLISGTNLNRSTSADDYGVWNSYADTISKTNSIKIIKVIGYR